MLTIMITIFCIIYVIYIYSINVTFFIFEFLHFFIKGPFLLFKLDLQIVRTDSLALSLLDY
jgi:hypothetical protein